MSKFFSNKDNVCGFLSDTITWIYKPYWGKISFIRSKNEIF